MGLLSRVYQARQLGTSVWGNFRIFSNIKIMIQMKLLFVSCKVNHYKRIKIITSWS